ncbi:cell division protein FtsA [Arundinibacter roseus]|nr:cell division protein FtsA [Arundinibacter roseus]
MISVGLDVGSTKVAAVAIESQENLYQDTVEVIGFSEVSVPNDAIVNGAVKNVKQVGMAIRSALSQLAMRSDLEIGHVNVSFGGGHVQVSSLSSSMVRPTSAISNEVTQEDVEHLIKDLYRAQNEPNFEVMHVIPGEFVVDNSPTVKEPVGRVGVRLGGDFLVVSGNRQAIELTKNSLKTADQSLEFDQLLLAPIAAGLAVLSEDEMEAGIALVDIGDHVTDIVIYQGGIIRYISSFPIAGRHITADLKTGCGIQLDGAELLKKKYGESLSENTALNIEILVNYLKGRPPKQVLKKNVALIIEERLKEIAALVYAEILESGFSDDLIGGIVLTGGTANLPEIETLFSRVANDMPVRVGIPERLAHTPKADFVSSTSYATALGLAWAGLKKIDMRIESICPLFPSNSHVISKTDEVIKPSGGNPLFEGLKKLNPFSSGDKEDKTGGGY